MNPHRLDRYITTPPPEPTGPSIQDALDDLANGLPLDPADAALVVAYVAALERRAGPGGPSIVAIRADVEADAAWERA